MRQLTTRIVVILLVCLLAWLGVPPTRAYLLLRSARTGHAPNHPAGLPTLDVELHAADGVPLFGWFIEVSARAPTVIPVPGFKADRTTMIPYARMLAAAGYNSLLYDPRGTGTSGGDFSLGLRDPLGVAAAVRFLDHRGELHTHRYGILGVSLGSGVAIVAAAQNPSIRAVIADSPYVDDHREVNRLDELHLGPLTLPLAPDGPWTVDRLLGTSLASFSPLRAARRLGARGLLLVHSRYDANPTTPLADAEALLRADAGHATVWIAPRGGHAGAITAQPGAYRAHVTSFLRRYLKE